MSAILWNDRNGIQVLAFYISIIIILYKGPYCLVIIAYKYGNNNDNNNRWVGDHF